MIDTEAKINVVDTQEGKVITIIPELLLWQRTALWIWVIVWMITGLLAIFGMYLKGSGDQLLYLLVFFSLWLYFLYYAGRAILWYSKGREFVRITDETLDYKRSLAGYGRAVQYDLGTIKELGMVNLGEKSFAKAYQNAFWTVGAEQIGFEYLGKKVVIGRRLSESDARKIIRWIQKKSN